MQTHKFIFHVEMTCGGCEKAVRGVLQKTSGVESVNIDMLTKQVTVTGTATKEQCLEAIKKTGKKVVAVN
jgi:copper chaperone